MCRRIHGRKGGKGTRNVCRGRAQPFRVLHVHTYMYAYNARRRTRGDRRKGYASVRNITASAAITSLTRALPQIERDKSATGYQIDISISRFHATCIVRDHKINFPRVTQRNYALTDFVAADAPLLRELNSFVFGRYVLLPFIFVIYCCHILVFF